MKVVFVLLAGLIATTACTKKAPTPVEVVKDFACSFEDLAVMSLSGVIVTEARCANAEPITAMVKKWGKQIDLCATQERAKKKKTEVAAAKNSAGVSTMGTVGDVVCAPIISTISFGLLMQLPPEAQCQGPVQLETVKADLLAKCLAAI